MLLSCSKFALIHPPDSQKPDSFILPPLSAHSAIFDASGRTLLATGIHGKLILMGEGLQRSFSKVWDWAFDQRGTAVNCATFVNGSGGVAGGGKDGIIRVWDLASRKSSLNLSQHTSEIVALAQNQQFGILASASRFGDLITHNSRTGEVVNCFAGSEEGFRCLALGLRDGNLLAGGLSSGTIQVYDLQRKMPLHSLSQHRKEVTGLCFTLGGNVLCSSSLDQTVICYDLREARARLNLKSQYPLTAVAYCLGGSHLAAGSYNGAIAVYQTRRPDHAPLNLLGHDYQIKSLHFKVDSAALATKFKTEDKGKARSKGRAVTALNMQDKSSSKADSLRSRVATTILLNDSQIQGRVRLEIKQQAGKDKQKPLENNFIEESFKQRPQPRVEPQFSQRQKLQLRQLVSEECQRVREHARQLSAELLFELCLQFKRQQEWLQRLRAKGRQKQLIQEVRLLQEQNRRFR